VYNNKVAPHRAVSVLRWVVGTVRRLGLYRPRI